MGDMQQSRGEGTALIVLVTSGNKPAACLNHTTGCFC
jgi:hypothetical protein